MIGKEQKSQKQVPKTVTGSKMVGFRRVFRYVFPWICSWIECEVRERDETMISAVWTSGRMNLPQLSWERLK